MKIFAIHAMVLPFLVFPLEFTAATQPAVPTFSRLTDAAGGAFTRGRQLSADGKIIVGRATTAIGVEPFRSIEGSGVVLLGQLPGGRQFGGAYDVSEDGSVVIGKADSPEGAEAFRWTENSGMVGLGDVAGGVRESAGYGVSADGSVVVGQSFSTFGSEGFRWTEHVGMVGLGDLPGGIFSSVAYNVSADGSTVVGASASKHGYEAFRWTDRTGMVGLGDLPGGDFDSIANDVSADGSVVVGMCESASGCEAFRWTEEEGMVSLGILPGNEQSIALGVSADGSVVVGWSGNGWRRDEAFVWDRAHGMRALGEVLSDLGAEVFGWNLSTAVDISADGKSILGVAVRPDGKIGGWLANFAPQPEPVSMASVSQSRVALLLALSALAAIGILWHRRLAEESVRVVARAFLNAISTRSPPQHRVPHTAMNEPKTNAISTPFQQGKRHGSTHSV